MARVDATSEDTDRPVESALSGIPGEGWRAGMPGEQCIALVFDEPVEVKRILLRFVETERQRTQEFVLTWSREPGSPAHIIVRQQWTFSPAGSTTEVEMYEVNLDNVGMLELMITPDISDRNAVATLAEWRIFGA